ncbi:hypothetical protein AB5J62_20350 [Amycolatopsis sp. cg5]|uniref:T4 family baseplate hub assembly chaperone n=1 Tax=Amycolatopsis sp. cg5 TaxID=3238802 RepID=UPI0035245000
MPGPTELLATWEAGLAAGPVRRAVLLHALTGAEDGGRLEVPVGRRDRELFALRRTLFGERLNGRVTCLDCETEQEFDFDVGNVVGVAMDEPGEVLASSGEWAIRLRRPTSGDLLAAAAAGPAGARRELVTRCAVETTHRGRPSSVDDLPADAQSAMADSLADADTAADVRLTMPCVECGRTTSATVDIVSYLWAELDAWARAVMLEVHLLASAYGWAEPEVLALSPTRRRFYLELVGHG